MIDFKWISESTQESMLRSCLEGLRRLKLRSDLGFLALPQRDSLWTAARKRAGELGPCDRLVVLGIGGSSLGVRVLRDFAAPARRLQLDILESPEEQGLVEFFESLEDLKRVHWVVISKSGSTLESLAQLAWLIPQYSQRGLPISEQMTVITERKSSPLYDWARELQIPCLEIPLDVGGRFSVLSPVGIFPAAWLGLETDELKRGAIDALRSEEAVAQLAAASIASFHREEWLTLFWAYGQKWQNFGLWWQQLWSESLAKKGGPRVSTPMRLKGPVDQHSVLQQIVEGARDKWVWMWKDGEVKGGKAGLGGRGGLESPFVTDWNLSGSSLEVVFETQFQATRQSLEQSGVFVLEIRPKDSTLQTLGFAFMFFQLLIGTLGEVLGVNAFDQPGVESGKRIAKKLLSQ